MRVALLTLGWSLLVIGFVGGLIPFLQGWPFGVLGIAILYVESRWFQRRVRAWRARHPKVERGWQKARMWLRERRRKRQKRAAPHADAP